MATDQATDDAIRSATPDQRRALKRQLWQQVASLAGQSWTPPNHPAFTVTIVNGPAIDPDRDVIYADVEITKNGSLWFSDDFTFPCSGAGMILVPDPAGSVQRQVTLPDGSTRTDTYRVDPRAAFIYQLKDALRLALGLG